MSKTISKARLFEDIYSFVEELRHIEDEHGRVSLNLEALIYDLLKICQLETRAEELISKETLKELERFYEQ